MLKTFSHRMRIILRMIRINLSRFQNTSGTMRWNGLLCWFNTGLEQAESSGAESCFSLESFRRAINATDFMLEVQIWPAHLTRLIPLRNRILELNSKLTLAQIAAIAAMVLCASVGNVNGSFLSRAACSGHARCFDSLRTGRGDRDERQE